MVGTADTALVARARGVATHLLPRPSLEALAEAPDLDAFARGLTRLGTAVAPLGEAPDTLAIQQAIRRTSAQHLETLSRWPQRVPGVLEIVRGDLDRRSLRALLRGAAEGAPADARVAGLIPTPRLPERLLTALARQPSPRAVVGLLTVLGDPDAAALAPLVAPTHPELFAIDAALLAGWAKRATAVAAREGSGVRDYVRLRIDLGNAQVALLLAGSGVAETSRVFVEGGRWLSAPHFGAAASAPTPRAALERLRLACSGSWLGQVLAAPTADVAAIERVGVAQILADLRRDARLDPTSSASLLHTLMRIEVQAHDLRSLAWGAALGAPPAMRKAQLVTT